MRRVSGAGSTTSLRAHFSRISAKGPHFSKPDWTFSLVFSMYHSRNRDIILRSRDTPVIS